MSAGRLLAATLMVLSVFTGAGSPAIHAVPPSGDSDHLTGHPVHDLYDPMRTRQSGSLDVLDVVPDSGQGYWIEDNGYGPERICGRVANHLMES